MTLGKNRSSRVTDKEYELFMRKLVHALEMLERIGEQDMGMLTQRYAARYHRITADLRDLTSLLSEDVAWPHEPIRQTSTR